MKATPKSLMLAGLALVAVFLVVALPFGYLGAEDADVAAAGNVVLTIGFGLGALVFLAGVLAWIIKLGVRAARE